ncbi:ABC transporter substrate-binding protein [Alloyangia pacifica]|uniref:ABC transporter substrate-binding protein n=1 Tax=Alloyangia pacifica TaxID=311180 RepID=UPI001CFDD791|nr:ABC transporter substrate-binding protein [Alloyangia pacifica]
MRHLTGATALAAMLPLAAMAQEVTVVMDPIASESTLYWETEGAFMLPSLQGLVGNNPETGKFDNSGLASSWETNDDLTSWTFTLKPEATFSGGWGKVTAADVVHSVNLHTGDDSRLSGIANLRAATVTAVDDHTVRFDFDSPQADFLFLLAGRGVLAIYSKAQFDAEGLGGYKTAPAGTGPFVYDGTELGQGMTFSAVKDHWSGISADYDTLSIRFVGEAATKLAMLLSNEADVVSLPRELQPQALDEGFEIIRSTQGASQTALVFGALYTDPEGGELPQGLPWADVRVREAMNRALDREQMLEALYSGRTEALPVFTMDEQYEGYTPELSAQFDQDYGYDPERAMELLAEAGYPEAFDNPVIPIILTSLPGNPEFPLISEMAQAFFESVGLQTEMREMDGASILAARRARNAPWVMPVRNAPIRPAQLGLQVYFSKVNRPTAYVDSPEINAMFDQLAAATDMDERDALASDIFTMLYQDYSHMPLAKIFAEVTVDPDSIESWTFPGSTSSGLSHYHLIKTAD